MAIKFNTEVNLAPIKTQLEKKLGVGSNGLENFTRIVYTMAERYMPEKSGRMKARSWELSEAHFHLGWMIYISSENALNGQGFADGSWQGIATTAFWLWHGQLTSWHEVTKWTNPNTRPKWTIYAAWKHSSEIVDRFQSYIERND
jgi:hypothetical protein